MGSSADGTRARGRCSDARARARRGQTEREGGYSRDNRATGSTDAPSYHHDSLWMRFRQTRIVGVSNVFCTRDRRPIWRGGARNGFSVVNIKIIITGFDPRSVHWHHFHWDWWPLLRRHSMRQTNARHPGEMPEVAVGRRIVLSSRQTSFDVAHWCYRCPNGVQRRVPHLFGGQKLFPADSPLAGEHGGW